MIFPAQQPNSIHYPMGRNIGQHMARIHGPTNHSRRLFGAKIIRDSAIARDTASWNEPYNVVDISKEISGFVHFQR